IARSNLVSGGRSLPGDMLFLRLRRGCLDRRPSRTDERIPMKIVPLCLAIAVPALAAGAFQQQPAPPSGPVAFVVSQRISNETTEGKAGIARMQALQRDRTADARTRQEALQATRRQIDATADSTDRTRLQAQEQQQRTELEKAVSQSQVDLQNLQRQISNELGV